MVEEFINPRTKEGFRVKTKIQRQLRTAKQRIFRRLDKSKLGDCSRPVFTAANIHYEIAQRTRGIAYGGLGAMVLLVRRLGLAEAIDRRLHLLKLHLPYHESDHVLNLAYNALCDGDCLEDIELRRNDEVFLDALGARRAIRGARACSACAQHEGGALQRPLFVVRVVGVSKRSTFCGWWPRRIGASELRLRFGLPTTAARRRHDHGVSTVAAETTGPSSERKLPASGSNPTTDTQSVGRYSQSGTVAG